MANGGTIESHRSMIARILLGETNTTMLDTYLEVTLPEEFVSNSLKSIFRPGVEPVNGTAVHKGWIGSQSLTEGIAARREAKYNVQLQVALLHEERPKLIWCLQSSLGCKWLHCLDDLHTRTILLIKAASLR
jgi:hypothetical protein